MNQQSEQREYIVDATGMELKQILKKLHKGRMRAVNIMLSLIIILLLAGLVLSILISVHIGENFFIIPLFIFSLPCPLLCLFMICCYPWFMRGCVKRLIETA